MKEIRISSKDLGAMALPDFCPRCFYMKRKAPKGIPFQIFPGIFSSIDSMTKRVVEAFITKYGAFPQWIAGFEDVTGFMKVPHWSKFIRFDPESGITLSGVPDSMLICEDGGLKIPDYKTARWTKTQDKLLPMYIVQNNGYRYIDEGLGHTVNSTPLIYFEPQTDIPNGDPDHCCNLYGFAMEFKPHILEVPQDTELVRNLLQKARDILDLEEPPEGADGCKDCEKVDGMLALL